MYVNIYINMYLYIIHSCFFSQKRGLSVHIFLYGLQMIIKKIQWIPQKQWPFKSQHHVSDLYYLQFLPNTIPSLIPSSVAYVTSCVSSLPPLLSFSVVYNDPGDTSLMSSSCGPSQLYSSSTRPSSLLSACPQFLETHFTGAHQWPKQAGFQKDSLQATMPSESPKKHGR